MTGQNSEQEPKPVPTVGLQPDPAQLPVRGLAYLGDAVYELWVREQAMSLLAAGRLASADDLHRFGVNQAKAERQIEMLQALDSLLSEAEREIVRRGRNIAVPAGRRANQVRHRLATGFEALIGFLHLSDPNRLQNVWAALLPLLEQER